MGRQGVVDWGFGMEPQSGAGVQHRASFSSAQQQQQQQQKHPVGLPVVLGRKSSPRPNISYRVVQPSDLEILQEIHEALFPIKYEMEFFLNVVHGKGIVAWAAVDTSRERHGDEVVGFVTARMIKASDAESQDVLGYEKAERTLLYILTLGVVESYRNFGIASALVWQVVEHASRSPACRAAYLHVIAYNRSAILFYQKNQFKCLRRLPKFYHINGIYYDAYLYIYYVNGGRSPCSALDLFAAAGAFLRNAFMSVLAKVYSGKDERVRAKLMGP